MIEYDNLHFISQQIASYFRLPPEYVDSCIYEKKNEYVSKNGTEKNSDTEIKTNNK